MPYQEPNYFVTSNCSILSSFIMTLELLSSLYCFEPCFYCSFLDFQYPLIQVMVKLKSIIKLLVIFKSFRDEFYLISLASNSTHPYCDYLDCFEFDYYQVIGFCHPFL